MSIWQILVLFSFLLLFPIGILAYSIETQAGGRAGAVVFLTSVAMFIMAVSIKEIWIESTQESNALPDLHGLCRADKSAPIELSYKVPRDDLAKLSNALIGEAGCNVKITRLQPPSALSEAFPKTK